MTYPRPKRLCKTIRITFTIGETHSTLKRIINLLNRISNTTPIESLPLDAGASSPPSKMAARMDEDHHRKRNCSLKESAPIESPYRKIEIPAASLWWLGSRKTWLRSLSGCEDDIGPVVLFLVGFSFPLAIITVSRGTIIDIIEPDVTASTSSDDPSKMRTAVVEGKERGGLGLCFEPRERKVPARAERKGLAMAPARPRPPAVVNLAFGKTFPSVSPTSAPPPSHYLQLLDPDEWLSSRSPSQSGRQHLEQQCRSLNRKPHICQIKTS